jgi:hypothetical protein
MDEGHTVLMAAKPRVIGLAERCTGMSAVRAVANKGGDGVACKLVVIDSDWEGGQRAGKNIG